MVGAKHKKSPMLLHRTLILNYIMLVHYNYWTHSCTFDTDSTSVRSCERSLATCLSVDKTSLTDMEL